VQDVFGLEDRINVPGTVGPRNWSWRMPWSADDLRRDPALAARTSELAQLTARHGRRPAAGRGAA
jgi:4-alpha-glucanotransferase